MSTEKQEPYGYFKYDVSLDAWVKSYDTNSGIAFYTHPPQRKPLTDEQIVAINDKHYNIAYRDFDADIAIARAIEAAHGIKGKA